MLRINLLGITQEVQLILLLFFFFSGLCRGEGTSECHPEAMAKCTDPLKVVTDNKDLGFATSKSELAKMCPKLMDGLRCIDSFTYRCLDREHRAYFNTLYAGTTKVIVDLCSEGSYQTDYLRHAPCMREVQNGYERCAADYQYRIKNLNNQQENGGDNERNVKLLCCSFQNYLFCSERIVNSTCGPETARFTKSFLDRMSGPLIQGHCQAYEQGLSENCLSQMTSSSSDFSSSSSSEQSRGSLRNPFSSSAPCPSTFLSLTLFLPSLLLLHHRGYHLAY